MRSKYAAAILVGLSLMATGCDTHALPSGVKPASAASLAPAPSAKVELTDVKLPQLLDALKAQHGKVVVVDFWMTTCVPCKKEFPRLVKLHERYAAGGLVCMSVTVDEQDRRAAALDFLRSRHATFANYFIDEPAEAWQNQFALKGVPGVLIWDRSGKQAGHYDNDDPDKEFSYDDVEKKVAELMVKQ